MKQDFIKADISKSFKNINGIFSFIDEKMLVANNLKYNQLYNKIAWIYNLSQRLYFFFKFGGEKNFRMPFLSQLIIRDEDKVLEVSVGTGDNFRFLNPKAKYFGVDISLGMLKSAKRHLKRWKIDSELIHCEGEDLPFPDNYFDVVYHCGGINYFNDKEKAIKEMIRVAKPGTEILIVDETEKLVKENYQKNPFIKNQYSDSDKAIVPLQLVPKTMKNVGIKILCKGLMYSLIFTKP